MTSDRVRDLAEVYRLDTADKLPVPLPAGEAGDGLPAWSQWPAEMKQAFKDMEPAAVYVAGADGPEPRRWGDNMGAWPVLLGITKRWDDTITPNMDRFSPMRWRGVLFRVWTLSPEHAKRLLRLMDGLIRDRVEQLRGSWLDFGPDFDRATFAGEVATMAKRAGIAAWDDEDFYREIRRMAKKNGERA